MAVGISEVAGVHEAMVFYWIDVGGTAICGDCLDGWRSGQGSFAGISPDDVTLATMDSMMDASMGPGGGDSSGWYSSGTSQEPRSTPMEKLGIGRQKELGYTGQNGLSIFDC